MKTTYAVILCVLLLLVSACAQKVNDPADVQAIKDTGSAWDKACECWQHRSPCIGLLYG